MKKYKCPKCGSPFCGHLRKAFLGSLKSKGKACPNCGVRITNGVPSVWFSGATSLLAAIAMFYFFFNMTYYYVFLVAVLSIWYVINRLFDAFFGELDVSRRIDI